MVRGFLVAVSFLTRIPVRVSPAGGFSLAAGAPYFPAAGLLIGGALSAAWALFSRLWPGPVADALVLVTWAAITGGIHLDGLADTADGVLSGRSPEKAMEIMRDSRVGAIGAVALVLFVLLKWTALGALPVEVKARALAVAPALGRWSMVYGAWSYSYPRAEGLGKGFAGQVGPGAFLAASAWAAGAAAALLGPGGVAMALAACAVGVLAARYVARRVGGLTGDAFGAVGEITEAAAVLFLGWPLEALSP